MTLRIVAQGVSESADDQGMDDATKIERLQLLKPLEPVQLEIDQAEEAQRLVRFLEALTRAARDQAAELAREAA